MSPANQPGTVDELTALYRETILRHAVHPVGYRLPIDATHSNEQFNPLCGDRIELRLRVADGAIKALAFNGEACAICMASASLLCERMSGQLLDELRAAHAWLEDALSRERNDPSYEALRPLLGVRRYPSRIKCAMLPWNAAIEALRDG